MNRPKWMYDPAIKNIPNEKLEFLSEMFEKVRGKSKNELMPFLMAMANKNTNTIRFTPDEMQRIINAIKRASTDEEQQQIAKILDMAAKKRK